MSDRYQAVRELPFSTVAGALGVDIGLFKTRKNGKEFYGPCPVHKPKNNVTSFSYNVDGRFQCFSCGSKGRGAIDLVKLARGIGFQDAVELLEGIKSLPQSETPQREAETSEIRPLKKDTWIQHQVPCEWLEKRVPDPAIRQRFGVFCYENKSRKSAYSGRVMLPVKDVEGHLYGYLGRKTDTATPDPSHEDIPKYLFPKNLPKSHFLFGADVLQSGLFGPAPLKRVYLLESPFAVMKFAMYGLPAVSSYGWSVSPEQIQILQQIVKGVIYIPDRNKREEAAKSSLAHLASCIWVRLPELPDGVDDPEYLSLEQILALT